MILTNLKKVLTSKYGIFWFILWVSLIVLSCYFHICKSKHQIIWWTSNFHYNFILTLDISLAILFWIFVWATLYKMIYFWNKKTSKVWFLWWFLWALATWCTSCTISFASFLWLGGLLNFLPFAWVEVKIISIILFLFANYYTLKNLEVCNLKLKTKKCVIKSHIF